MSELDKNLAALTSRLEELQRAGIEDVPLTGTATELSMEGGFGFNFSRLTDLGEEEPLKVRNPKFKVAFIFDGEPFGEGGGESLVKIVAAMGLSASDVVLTRLTPTDLGISHKGVGRSELSDFLLSSGEGVLAIAFGDVAVRALTGRGQAAVRGRFVKVEGLPVMPTYHPSEFISNERVKRATWDDIKLVIAAIKG